MQKSTIYGAISMIALATSLYLMLNHAEDTTQSNTSVSLHHWQLSNNFSQARRAFAAATNGRYIYIVGGIDDSSQYLASVEFAPIQHDGAIGAWQQTSPLREGRFYLSSVIIGDYIYAIGGANGPLGEDNIPSASVERAQILPTGELGTWEKQSYMTSPRRGLQTVAYKNYLFALGGYNGKFLKTVERASVDASGVISEWQALDQSFIVDRYIHSAALHNNRIYLIAGHVEKQDKLSYNDVESTQIDDNGNLSAWRIEKSILNIPRFIASATSSGNSLYIAAGHDGANRLNSVETARINDDGTLGAWQQTLPLETARSAAALVSSNNTLYALGGAGGDNVLDSVEISRQLPGGKLIASEPK